MKTRDVPEYDLMHMLLSAFRYALGSRTGIVGTVSCANQARY
jgi:hypothetical protein